MWFPADRCFIEPFLFTITVSAGHAAQTLATEVCTLNIIKYINSNANGSGSFDMIWCLLKWEKGNKKHSSFLFIEFYFLFRYWDLKMYTIYLQSKLYAWRLLWYFQACGLFVSRIMFWSAVDCCHRFYINETRAGCLSSSMQIEINNKLLISRRAWYPVFQIIILRLHYLNLNVVGLE